LNNVLSPILMGIQLLRDGSDDERRFQILDTLELSALRGADLVKQVLTFARGIEGKRGLLQVRYILTDVEKILDQTLPKSIRMETSLSKDLLPVSGDSTQLHQLVMNLC